ncbi:methylmalonyl-CoA mutase family protein [Roseiarcus sp.]|uniref:methylmalonyl-CoA mutase family protein n=1 Tax=Roseiarcus sp. TaxID=1969460 RepID=UPI003F97835B
MDAEAGGFPAWTEADWRKAAEAALKGASLDKLVSKTADGLRIDPVYPPAVGPRAVRAGGPWKVIARLDHPDAREANAQALEDLSNGADGLQIVFAGAIGAYGFGLKRSDPATLAAAFEGVQFDAGARFELDLGPSGPAEALAFANHVRATGAEPAICAVSFGLDPFAVAARGPFPSDWAAHVKPYVDAALELKSGRFNGPFFVADARSVHAAGGSAAQELAFALGAGVSLLRALGEAGIAPDKARSSIAFRLASDAEEFVEIAKFRALRIVWARVEEACGLAPRAPYVQAESAWRMMTRRHPYLNVLRGTIAAFAAGLGGADSVSVLPHPLAVGFPGSLARRLARNGQLVLLRESHLGFVDDPAAGAGGFEALTKALCDKSWAVFQEIEAKGGLPAALADGGFQRQVAENAAALRRDVARIKSPITGVSAHPQLVEAATDIAPGAPEPEFVAAAAGALAPFRLAEAFEALRDQSDACLQKTGARPKAYLVAIGAEPVHRRRVAYMRELFETGGVQPVYDGEAATPEDAVAKLKASGAELACLCSDDETYAARAEAFATAVKAAGVKGLTLAGRPGDLEQRLRAAGVDDFIFMGGDAVAALKGLYKRVAP